MSPPSVQYLIASLVLGGVERGVGYLHQFLDRLGVARVGDPEAGREPRMLTRVGGAEPRAQSLQDGCGLRLIEAREDEDELFSAPAADQVILPDGVK